MTRQQPTGSDKRVSEPVYPNDILGDRAISGADLATQGAWFKCLLFMWRDKCHSVTDTIEGFAHTWGCSESEADRIVKVIHNRQIADVVTLCNANVTLTCRRLQRREKQRDMTQNRVKKHRCNALVTSKKHPLSVSSSVSSLKTDGEHAPSGSTKQHAPAPQEAELNMLVKQFTARCVWTGEPAPVYKHLRALLQHYPADAISAQIANAQPGNKPWDIADALNKASRTSVGDIKPYKPDVPPGAGPIDKYTLAKCFEATRKQIKTEANA